MGRIPIATWLCPKLRRCLMGSSLPLAQNPVEVGQFAVALGSPFGEQGTMTLASSAGSTGACSSQRTITTAAAPIALPQVIQTDAPIANPATRGAAAESLTGKNRCQRRDRKYFAPVRAWVSSIPADVVRRVVPSLIESGEVNYPYMGVSFDGEIKARYGSTASHRRRGAYDQCLAGWAGG